MHKGSGVQVGAVHRDSGKIGKKEGYKERLEATAMRSLQADRKSRVRMEENSGDGPKAIMRT